MSKKRRRAYDFTDSLTSFRQTISEEESSLTMFRAFSENRLDSIRSKQDEGDKHSHLKNNTPRGSIILAGSLTSQQCISLSDSECNTAKKNYNTTYNDKQPLLRDTWNVSDETSYLPVKPDLNKCINLFHNEHLMKGDSLEQQLNATLSETTINENINIRLSKDTAVGQQEFNKHSRSMSADSLKKTILLDQELPRSKSYTTLDRILKRDTNYNIKFDQLSSPSKIVIKISHNDKVETIIPSFNELLLSKPSATPNRKDDSYSTNSEKSSKEELDPCELRTFLHSLAEKPLEQAGVQQHLLRRLSANYYDSPRVFTEGLLTIIEESVINNDSLQYPDVSLHRFNDELRKVYKFIEDETVPEWPQSPGMSTPICAKRKSQEPKSNLSWRSVAFGTPDKGLRLTPDSPRPNIKSPKKICRRISKNTSYLRKNLHDSTNTFENLEAYCEKLYPNEYKTLSARETNQLQSPLRNMDNIRRACETQMASLESSSFLTRDSLNLYEALRKAGTCTSDSANRHNQTPETQNLKHRLMLCENYDRNVSDTFKQRAEHSKRHEMIKLDDFESTLMYEIAKKRQRCFDTAKVTMEIDANLDSTEAIEKTYPNIVIHESSPTTNDDKFMKILMCVKKYQDYLEEHKPLLNLVHRTRLNSPRTPREDNVRAKKMPNKNFGTCASSVLLGDKPTLRTPKLSPRKKSISPSSAKHRPNTVVSKPRLFVTPGKTSVNKSCRPKRTYFPNLLPGLNKSDEPNPTAKKVYRQMGNYDHVISPVGMYIKGTESHLKKNLRSKTDEKLVTPKGQQTVQSPGPKMKFRLSPKRPKEVTGTTKGNKNVAGNFSHSKMYGKLQSYVHTVKEAESRKVGNRVNELPCSTRGRTKSARTDHLE